MSISLLLFIGVVVVVVGLVLLRVLTSKSDD